MFEVSELAIGDECLSTRGVSAKKRSNPQSVKVDM